MKSLFEQMGGKYHEENSYFMGLNFLAIAFAITGLLGSVIGALVHNAGSVLVIINSALLLSWKKE